MITVPEAFFKSGNVEVLMRDGQNSIIKKSTSVLNPDNDRYVSTHAITIVTRGTLKLQIPDGPIVTVTENNMVFIPRGLYLISDIIPEPDPFEAFVIFYSDEVLESFLKDFNLLRQERTSTSISPFTIPFYEDLHSLINQTTSMYDQEDKAMLIPKLKEFLYLVMKKSNSDFIRNLNALNSKRKEGIRSFMEKNFDKPLKIEDYAHLTGRSVASFHRDFKRQFGIGPKTWILQKRMERSKKILDNNSISISQLAHESGYENVSHFIKAFQKQFGISPKQYQIEKREKALI